MIKFVVALVVGTALAKVLPDLFSRLTGTRIVEVAAVGGPSSADSDTTATARS